TRSAAVVALARLFFSSPNHQDQSHRSTGLHPGESLVRTARVAGIVMLRCVVAPGSKFALLLSMIAGFSRADAGPIPATRSAPAAASAPDELRLRNEVAILASPQYEGRRGEGGRKTAAHLVESFRDLELDPLFEGGYEQPIPGDAAASSQGRNVGARLLGSDPALRDEWIILSAHFDHLGVRGGVLY